MDISAVTSLADVVDVAVDDVDDDFDVDDIDGGVYVDGLGGSCQQEDHPAHGRPR